MDWSAELTMLTLFVNNAYIFGSNCVQVSMSQAMWVKEKEPNWVLMCCICRSIVNLIVAVYKRPCNNKHRLVLRFIRQADTDI